MKYYEITVRVSAEALDAIAIENPDASVPTALGFVGERLVYTIRDQADRYDKTTAQVVKVDGPFRERGRIVDSGPGSLLTDLDGYQADLARTRNELNDAVNRYDGILKDVLENAPACWDGDTSMEALAIAYVRHLEAEADRVSSVTHRDTCEGKC